MGVYPHRLGVGYGFQLMSSQKDASPHRLGFGQFSVGSHSLITEDQDFNRLLLFGQCIFNMPSNPLPEGVNFLHTWGGYWSVETGKWSGRRGSNPQPSAWKADTLAN